MDEPEPGPATCSEPNAAAAQRRLDVWMYTGWENDAVSSDVRPFNDLLTFGLFHKEPRSCAFI